MPEEFYRRIEEAKRRQLEEAQGKEMSGSRTAKWRAGRGYVKIGDDLMNARLVTVSVNERNKPTGVFLHAGRRTTA
jgi:hypothetical protein